MIEPQDHNDSSKPPDPRRYIPPCVCLECGGLVSSDDRMAELVCVKCGLVASEQTYPLFGYSKKEGVISLPDSDRPRLYDKEINADIVRFCAERGIRLSKDDREIIAYQVSKVYHDFRDRGFTRFGKRSIKDELKRYALFRYPDIRTIPCNVEAWREYFETFKILQKKTAKAHVELDLNLSQWKEENQEVKNRFRQWKEQRAARGLTGVPPLPVDNFAYLAGDIERLNQSFTVPYREVLDLMFSTGRGIELLIKARQAYDNAIDKGRKPPSFDYIMLLSTFQTIERLGYGKLLKPYTELSKLWNIPITTLKNKMAFFRSL